MRIAVVGAGISGLTVAWLLGREHDVVVFEREAEPGGHAATLDVSVGNERFAVDGGFVVFNETTYPNFRQLLQRLDVASQPTEMSFSVQCESTGLEFCGTSLDTLFAQRRNLLRPGFYRLLIEILRFNRLARRAASRASDGGRLGEFLSRAGLSPALHRYYLGPLISAIWSNAPDHVNDFPEAFFLKFASRHRLLQVGRQLEWRVIRGGARAYVVKLVGALRGGVRTGVPVRGIRRFADRVDVDVEGAQTERFDHVVLATHSDQSLRLLLDPAPAEQAALGGIGYQTNHGLLHTDAGVLPRSRRAWASWNYRLPRGGSELAVTTYDMSRLQGLRSASPICITLNGEGLVDPTRVVRRLRWDHPIYTPAAIQAQNELNRLDASRRTSFCGAYRGYGFHEDGVNSALAVGKQFGISM